VVELRCTYDPATRGGATPDGRSVRGTIQWVSAPHALACRVRLYDRLFTVPDPETREEDFRTFLNPDSLVEVEGALVEPSVGADPPGSRYQFERIGYFCSDAVDSRPGAPVFNRTVTLRDTRGRPGVDPAAGERDPRPTGRARSGARQAGPAPPRSAPAAAVRSPALQAARERFERELGLAPADAEVLTRDEEIAGLLEATVALGAPARAVANWIVNVVLLEVKERGIVEVAFTPAELAELVRLVEDGTLGSAAARTVLAEMVRGGGSPAAIVERRGLRQVSDEGALGPVVEAVLDDHRSEVEAYRAGKAALLGFFVGQVMRRTGGTADPARVRALLAERLSGG
jgi:glutaminyl-tRNA synthetase